MLVVFATFHDKRENIVVLVSLEKGFTKFVEKCVTGKRKRFRPYKVHIYISEQDQ